jgi:hypothetical protein
MHEAFWNGLFDVRWEEAPLGAEAIRLTVRLSERCYAGRTCRDYGHAAVHPGKFLHEERDSDQVRDDEVVADFLAGHLPGCRCYRRPVGRGEEPVRRGLAHLLVMLREEGTSPPVVADEPPWQELIEGYCRFPRQDRGLTETTVVTIVRPPAFRVHRTLAVTRPPTTTMPGAGDSRESPAFRVPAGPPRLPGWLLTWDYGQQEPDARLPGFLARRLAVTVSRLRSGPSARA